ncbi:MAG: non-hydrolyzing UDP-N-acetylglucosamine 2-epimerase, partial [Bacteroidota bacterium]
FVKAAVISKKFLEYENIKEIIIHTGQHFDENMSDIFFHQMNIPKPSFFLGVNSCSHGEMTAKMLEKIEQILLVEKPDWVLVYGDTNSTLAGTLAAVKLQIKIAHVEAGLRSYNMAMPEEVNRILTDRVSNLLLCPTDVAVNNLKKEGYDYIDHCKIAHVGDVMQDATYLFESYAQPPIGMASFFDFVLVTIHRAENTDNIENINAIFESLVEIANRTKVILPLHPRTRFIINSNRINTGNILLIEPIGYLNMLWLIKNCKLIMTDSGGLQKESYFFNKYCITLRTETEWKELVENGYNYIVGSDKTEIINNYISLENKDFLKREDLFGGGDAASRIVNEILNY